MAKHGLGRGLSALFSLYDDPQLANSEVEKKKMADIAKKVEEQKLELKRQEENLKNEQQQKASIVEQEKTSSYEEKLKKENDVLERAKNLLNETK